MATRQWIKVGAALAAGAAGVMAQNVVAQGSDPVTVARAGAGVAFGRSLEAAALNPALLFTIQDSRAGYMALGVDSQASFTTLQGNQHKSYSDDRNRVIETLGAAWSLSSGFKLGFVLDQPFRRQIELKHDSDARFQGDKLALMGRRMEAQLAWSPEGRPEWSFGVGLGLTRVELELGSTLRAVVPLDPTQPVGTTNAVADIAEFQLREKGSKIVPSYTLGARWAVGTRWTLGASYQSGVKTSLVSEASRVGSLWLYDQDGFSRPTVGAGARANTLFSLSQVKQGGGDLKLPSRLTFGVRQRLNQLFTWEADLRFTLGGTAMPTFASLQTPSGNVPAASSLQEGKGTQALLLAGEVTLSKLWTLRMGASLESAALAQERGNPLLATGSQATFSGGAGYKVWGGELSLGYQLHYPRKQDRLDLAGDWAQAGFRSSNSVVRYEGVGHLLTLGFRRSF